MIVDRFYAGIWLCEPDYLQYVLEPVANRVKGMKDSDAKQHIANLAEDKSSSSTEPYNIGSVRVIPIEGSIFKKSSFITEVCGLTSTDVLQSNIAKAVEDSGVESILLRIDSPGGEATGISELADFIYRSRDVKPIKSYIYGYGCSAAYWIASATEEIIANDTATLGSIGVAYFITDESDKEAKLGVKRLVIKNDLSPNKAADYRDAKGRKLLVDGLNSHADVFFSKVALYRSSDKVTYSKEDVVNFKKGGVAVGKEAVAIGLADRLGTFEQLIIEMGENAEMAVNKKSDAVDTVQIDASEFNELKDSFAEYKKAAEANATNLNGIIETLKDENKKVKETSTIEVESLKESLDSFKSVVEAQKASLLESEAEKVSMSKSNKLTSSQIDDYKELYKSFKAEGNDKGISLLDSLVNGYDKSKVLEEEYFVEVDKLTVLDQNRGENSLEDELDGLSAATSKYAAEANARGEV